MPPLNTPLKGSRDKIARADENIRRLGAAVRAFLDPPPFTVAKETEPASGHIVWQATNVRSLPDEVVHLTSEVLQPLRTALDYLAQDLVDANRAVASPRCGFPIALTLPAYKRMAPSMVKGMSRSAMDRIEKLQPFTRPDPAQYVLTLLHELNNMDKHRLPIKVVATAGANPVELHFTEETRQHMTGTTSIASTIGAWNTVTEGVELFRVMKVEPPMDIRPQFNTHVLVEWRGGDKELVFMVTEMSKFVKNVVGSFGSEFR